MQLQARLWKQSCSQAGEQNNCFAVAYDSHLDSFPSVFPLFRGTDNLCMHHLDIAKGGQILVILIKIIVS